MKLDTCWRTSFRNVIVTSSYCYDNSAVLLKIETDTLDRNISTAVLLEIERDRSMMCVLDVQVIKAK